jgi:hypothetical protein
MRLICPHCMSGVTVPDDAAGKEAICPNCGKSFPTPARYTANVVPEAPVPVPVAPPVAPMPAAVPQAPAAPTPSAPPGYVPAPVPPLAPSGFLPATPAAPGGYAHARGLTISPRVVAWFPAVFLTLALVLTFFPWVGSYATHAVYSQNPWRAAVRSVYRDFTLEKLIPIPTGWLDKVRSDWSLMVPYLLCLIAAVALAWGDRGLNAFDPQRFRPLARVWPHRQAVVFGLGTLALLLALVQVWRGFGMERAMRGVVDEQFAAQRADAAGSPSKLEQVDYEVDQAYAKFHLETTTWAYLALAFNALAITFAIVRWLLERRGNKPPPRLVLHY